MRKATTRRDIEQITVAAGNPMRRVRRDVLATEEPLEIRVVLPFPFSPLVGERAGERGESRGADAADRVERRSADSAAGDEHRRPQPAESPHSIAVTMRTPGADFELAAGFLYGESLIESGREIAAIRYCVDAATDGAQQFNIVNVELAAGTTFDPATLQRNFYMSSSCGVCGKASIEAVWPAACDAVGGALRVRPETLLALPDVLRGAQRVFDRTGGLHAAGLFSADGTLLRLREDVGRHNAMDKLIGAALLGGELPLSDAVVLVSGRLSFELVQKAARAGIALLAGVSAPSSLAVELAATTGMTLVGFLRGERFNIYTGRERIVTGPGEGEKLMTTIRAARRMGSALLMLVVAAGCDRADDQSLRDALSDLPQVPADSVAAVVPPELEEPGTDLLGPTLSSTDSPETTLPEPIVPAAPALDTPVAPATPAPPPAPAPVPAPQAEADGELPGWKAGATRVRRRGQPPAVLREVRAARNAGFDRVVFEFSGQRMPGYQIEYVDRPVRQCGSGRAVQVAGDGWLVVRMSPAQAHTDAGEPTVQRREASLDYPVLRELQSICDFEGQVAWVLGVASPNRYRVLQLADPLRLVVDVRH